MSKCNSTSRAIEQMVRFFLPFCTDTSTLTELRDMAPDPKQWREAHNLFGRIRDKTLRTDRSKTRFLILQYSFEEICAKTLYNMADHGAGFGAKYLPPFDDDAPFWVVPLAIAFARHLGVSDLGRVCECLRDKEAG